MRDVLLNRQRPLVRLLRSGPSASPKATRPIGSTDLDPLGGLGEGR